MEGTPLLMGWQAMGCRNLVGKGRSTQLAGNMGAPALRAQSLETQLPCSTFCGTVMEPCTLSDV